jgi:hypothetical protein
MERNFSFKFGDNFSSSPLKWGIKEKNRSTFSVLEKKGGSRFSLFREKRLPANLKALQKAEPLYSFMLYE